MLISFSFAQAQWTALGNFRDVHMVANGVGQRLEVGWNGSSNGGGTWQLLHTIDDWNTPENRSGDPTGGSSCCYPDGFAVYDDNVLFMAIRDGGVYHPYRSTNGGFNIAPFGGDYFDLVNWAQAYSPDEWYLTGTPYSMDSKLLVFKQIASQRILLLDDEKYIGTKARLQKVADSLLFVSTMDTNGIVRLLRTTNDGNSWTNPLSVGLGDYLAIDFVNAQVGYVGGSNGTCYKTEDGGMTWNSLFLNGPVNVGAIDFINPDTGFVATQEGLLLTTRNGGQTWTSELVDSMANFYKLQAISEEVIYAHSTTKTLYKRGSLVTSSEALAVSQVRMKLVPNGQPNGYEIQLPEQWALKAWQIFDLKGGLIREGTSNELSLEGQASGIYLIRIATNKGLESFKISKI